MILWLHFDSYGDIESGQSEHICWEGNSGCSDRCGYYTLIGPVKEI